MDMDIHGYPWISMDIHGYPWTSMDIHGHPWISMDIHGYLRLCTVRTAPPRGKGTPGTTQGEDNRRGKRTHKDTTRLMTPRGRRITSGTCAQDHSTWRDEEETGAWRMRRVEGGEEGGGRGQRRRRESREDGGKGREGTAACMRGKRAARSWLEHVLRAARSWLEHVLENSCFRYVFGERGRLGTSRHPFNNINMYM
jgi:hypothetical protein